jgi:hypothetical protein
MRSANSALKSRQEGEDGEGHEMSAVRNGAANGGRAVGSTSLQDFLSEVRLDKFPLTSYYINKLPVPDILSTNKYLSATFQYPHHFYPPFAFLPAQFPRR